ncbi:MAG: large subunit ribosomal protein L24 [Parcubacteria group bacterium Gr01-1014_73]|nr:MAG: large subunit ribosomal protein L24 [Parcubacteria group bacterium Gr01-1014_73]
MVEVITGADRGKSGKVVLALPRENKVIVEGINRRKHHQKPKRANQKGQVVEKAMPIHVSNVRLAKK